MSSVTLHLYDLSGGMCAQLSQKLAGKYFEAIWHSGICVFGREYFFGGGIFHNAQGQTPYGVPTKTVHLGSTAVTQQVFEEFLNGIRSRFRMQDYDLIAHNCNNFTNECSEFLVGCGIPNEILQFPAEMLSTPIGQALRPMLEARRMQMNDFYRVEAERESEENARVFRDAKNRSKAIEKLRLFVKDVVEAEKQLDEEQMDNAVYLVALCRRLPAEKRFPALDLLRIALLNEQQCAAVYADDESREFVREMFAIEKNSHVGGARMTLRCVANALTTASGQKLLLRDTDVAVQCTCRALELVEDQASIVGAAACAHHLANRLTALDDDARTQLLMAVSDSIARLQDANNSAARSLLLALKVMGKKSETLLNLASALQVDLAQFAGTTHAQLAESVSASMT